MTLSFCSRICTEKFSTFSYKNNGGYRDQNMRKKGLNSGKKSKKCANSGRTKTAFFDENSHFWGALKRFYS